LLQAGDGIDVGNHLYFTGYGKIKQKELWPMHLHSILIVDDEHMILKAIQRVLRHENYNLLTTDSPQDGLRLLEGRDFDLVISDHNMPHMTGLDFLQRVKADHPGMLTIMLTGQKEIEVAVQAINHAGVYKFIMKPWDDDDLKITIRRALESLDLVRERDTLNDRIKERDAILRNLERTHPGITQVNKDEEGYLILE
jgi:DNA-binding NtrC family response regulator